MAHRCSRTFGERRTNWFSLNELISGLEERGDDDANIGKLLINRGIDIDALGEDAGKTVVRIIYPSSIKPLLMKTD
jgi:hypothetical protein